MDPTNASKDLHNPARKFHSKDTGDEEKFKIRTTLGLAVGITAERSMLFDHSAKVRVDEQNAAMKSFAQLSGIGEEFKVVEEHAAFLAQGDAAGLLTVWVQIQKVVNA